MGHGGDNFPGAVKIFPLAGPGVEDSAVFVYNFFACVLDSVIVYVFPRVLVDVIREGVLGVLGVLGDVEGGGLGVLGILDTVVVMAWDWGRGSGARVGGRRSWGGVRQSKIQM